MRGGSLLFISREREREREKKKRETRVSLLFLTSDNILSTIGNTDSNRRGVTHTWNDCSTTCADNWLRTVTSDRTVYNNSSLSFRTRRGAIITGWKWLIIHYTCSALVIHLNVLKTIGGNIAIFGTKDSRRAWQEVKKKKEVRKRPRHLPFVKASHSCRPASLNIFLRYPFPRLSTLWSLSSVRRRFIPRVHRNHLAYMMLVYLSLCHVSIKRNTRGNNSFAVFFSTFNKTTTKTSSRFFFSFSNLQARGNSFLSSD